jgi:hypothetical protein
MIAKKGSAGNRVVKWEEMVGFVGAIGFKVSGEEWDEGGGKHDGRFACNEERIKKGLSLNILDEFFEVEWDGS